MPAASGPVVVVELELIGAALDVVTNVVGPPPPPPGAEDVSVPPTGLSLEMTTSEDVDGVA